MKGIMIIYSGRNDTVADLGPGSLLCGLMRSLKMVMEMLLVLDWLHRPERCCSSTEDPPG